MNLVTVIRNGKVLASHKIPRLKELGFVQKSKLRKSRGLSMLFGLGYNYNQFNLQKEPERVLVGEILMLRKAIDYSLAENLYSIADPCSKTSINWLAEKHKLNLNSLNKDLKTTIDEINSCENKNPKTEQGSKRPIVFYKKVLDTKSVFPYLKVLIYGRSTKKRIKDEDSESFLRSIKYLSHATEINETTNFYGIKNRIPLHESNYGPLLFSYKSEMEDLNPQRNFPNFHKIAESLGLIKRFMLLLKECPPENFLKVFNDFVTIVSTDFLLTLNSLEK